MIHNTPTNLGAYCTLTPLLSAVPNFIKIRQGVLELGPFFLIGNSVFVFDTDSLNRVYKQTLTYYIEIVMYVKNNKHS